MDIQSKMRAAFEAQLNRKRLNECYDSLDLNSRPSQKQLEIMKDIGKIQVRYLIASNQSGKTSLGAREIAWILNDTHPWWKRPKEWGEGPLMIIIAGQSRANIEEEIWKRKLLPLLLDKEDWKEKKNSNNIVSATNIKTGDTIMFLVHGAGSDSTRAHLQGFRAHYVLLDEMPNDFGIVSELQLRIDAFRGYMLVTFTPLLDNMQIKNAVELAQAPYSKKYVWIVWDNPCNLIPEKKEAILQRAAGWSESERQTRLYGAWSQRETAVYHLNIETMVSELPAHYSPVSWRHVEAVDPATTGITGYTLWAEDPKTHIWWCVKAVYIKGDRERSPTKNVEGVVALSQGYNIVRRVSDTMPWFISTANEMGITYMQPWNKVQRKDSLIKNLQEALSSGKIMIATTATLLIEELLSCRWADSGTNRIVAHQHYHCADCAQYFVDLMPPTAQRSVSEPVEGALMRAWEKEKVKIAKIEKARIQLKHRYQSRLRRR